MTTRIVKAHLQMLGFTVLLDGSFIASATISNSLPPMVITWASLIALRYMQSFRCFAKVQFF